MFGAIIFILFLIILGIAVGIRSFGRIGRLWLITSANALALIVSDDKEDGKTTQGGGAIVDLRHAIPGKFIDKTDPDPMNWEVKDLPDGMEVDPRHDKLLYKLLGVEWISLFPSVRTNSDVHLRFSNKRDADGNRVVENSDQLPKFIYYSGDLVANLEGLETKDQLKLGFRFNLIFERVFPIRSVLRVSNPLAYLEGMIESIVSNIVGGNNAADYRGGANSGKLKQDLVDAIMKNDAFHAEALEQLGLKIKSMSMLSPTMDPKQEAILELQVQAEAQARVRITNAEAEKKEKMLLNDAAADLYTRVTEPTMKLANEPANRWATAHEKNGVATTVVYGSGALPVVGGTK
ncbi:MAG: hypothetical protein AB200_00250 [Parcubacteria bacterium C7867-005]|nr:MAG: hypothetical protein AB200_00250 [Parcubacteria bacterium C7867-005]